MSRALVLGGGGQIGIAWETGLAAGLLESGIDLREADVIIGTSAGSVVGGQLAMGKSPAQMYAAMAAEAGSAEPTRAAGDPGGGGAPPNLMPLMQLMQKAASGKVSPEELRKEIGAFALKAKTMGEAELIASFGRMLGSSETWPDKDYRCTAVDAETGDFVVWSGESGVPLSRAIASSCAVPGIFPPITIEGRRYMDGGMRSATNGDLAKGYERVILVSATSGGEGPLADRGRMRLEGEVRAIEEAGGRVTLVAPDAASRAAFGTNLMDPSSRAGAAEAGFALGRALAPTIEW